MIQNPRQYKRRLTRRDRAHRHMHYAVGMFLAVAGIGAAGWLLHPAVGTIGALAVGAAFLTQGKIDRAGLGDVATVVHAPLVDVSGMPMSRYYDVSKLPADAGPFDFVFVDGPVGGDREPLARYGLLPLLRDRLAPGALLLLDDGLRPGEQEVARRWGELVPSATVTFLRSRDGMIAVELPA